MEFSAQQIADFLKGEVVGDSTIKVSDFSKIEEGRPGTLTFLSNPKYTEYIYTTKASVVLVNSDFVPEKEIGATLIKVANSYEALAMLLSLVESMKPKKQGVSSLASISESATIGENAYIGPYAVIESGAKIGKNVQIYPHVYIGENVTIGEDVILYPNVTIYHGCKIGDRCILHAGCVLGSDGFGFAPSADGHYDKIPQIGIVTLESDVEIGANTTVDRSTMGTTLIKRGAKLDNLIQIAHNVEVGEDTVMAALTGIAGSSKIGKRCMFGGQSGVVGHVNMADGTILAARAGVTKDLTEPNAAYSGYPQLKLNDFQRSYACFRQLPIMRNQLNDLKKKIDELSRLLEK
jgi:UDP-3-O-[3-hydroxymyristoyl] glucosamine N-acyltransferase